MYGTAIETIGLTKRYGDIIAVEDVSLSFEKGIFGLLGPNGAGKSTMVLMLTTLLRPTSGTAFICGYDILKDPEKVRESISYVPQDLAVDDKLTGRENVLMFARLYGVVNAKDKSDEVLALLELQDRADTLTNTYSGGMKRRLELAQALVHEPEVLFFDEPTVGLDVGSRTRIWSHLKGLASDGISMFVTTHYMEEADAYCDVVAIIDHGKIKAIDTPEHLKNKMSRSMVTITTQDIIKVVPDLNSCLRGVTMLEPNEGELRFLVEDGEAAIPAISEAMVRNGIKITSISVKPPSLNEVFLKSVGTEDETWNKKAGQKFKRMVRRSK